MTCNVVVWFYMKTTDLHLPPEQKLTQVFKPNSFENATDNIMTNSE